VPDYGGLFLVPHDLQVRPLQQTKGLYLRKCEILGEEAEDEMKLGVREVLPRGGKVEIEGGMGKLKNEK
jgi:hypothetical protein